MRADVLGQLLDGREITPFSFARRTLYSWTSSPGARWLVKHEPPVLLRWQVHPHPPDVSFYDVHLRSTEDDTMGGMLGSPPFDHVRYAWPNPWGACDGLGDERYGDQLIRVALRPESLLVRFVPRTDEGLDGRIDDGNPYRFGLPEWSFFDLAGNEVPRVEALANARRIAAVFHASPTRRRPEAGVGFSGYREYVLVNESMIESWSLGSPEVRAALGEAADVVDGLVVPGSPLAAPRTADDGLLSRVMLVDAARAGGFDALPLESRWLLTLPFPRAQYSDLRHLSEVLHTDAGAQHFTRAVASPP
ncbi:MAG: hypothetical protein ABI175_06655 [Polyangiales bacterium]